MIRVPGTESWDLVEVKSSTSPKPQYDDDIAIQALVIETSGVRLRKKMVLVIDNSYVFDGAELDLQNYFSLHDRTSKVDAKEQETRESLDRLHDVSSGEVPAIEPSPHCRQPYLCPFWDYCTENVPKNWIMQLPRISGKAIANLRAQGIESTEDIPADFALTDPQARVRTSVVTDAEWVSPGLANMLLEHSPANHFLDFETFNPAIPIYGGTRPFEKIPFQWSCHSENDESVIEHAEFLAEPTGDPRRAFAESLIDHVGGSGRVVVYSPFEKGVITGLENQFPDLADKLQAIKERLWDLLDVIRNNYYHPGFHGSYSIKAVLPALVPELAYSDLALQAGDSAAASYQSMVMNVQIDDGERLRIESELKDYCARDTFAMVKILGKLRLVAS
jgi:predicted RecB family nuclease